MPPSISANCNPAMLGWARNDAGYTLEKASERTRYSVERLREWEAGESKPTIPQLRNLANAYRRPLAAFFLREPPQGFQPVADFRRLPDAELQWTPALRALLRRTRGQQNTYLELLADLGVEPRELPLAPDVDDPETVGAFARETLAVPLEVQREWRDESTALRGWTRAVQDAGVLVLHTSTTRGQTISPDEMLGFSDSEPIPVIVLNGKDHARRRVFTLLHEFAHLLLGRAGVCDLHDRYTTPNFDPTEVFCNAVAAAALMPREPFLGDPSIRSHAGHPEWDDETLGAIARRFTTSREAVLRRLLTLRLTTEDYYRRWREEYNQRFDARQDDDESDEASGFANYYTMKVRELGLPYISAALEAYSADVINASDLARALNIKLKNLARVEEEVARAMTREA